jgi:hypothetical protein
MSDAGLWRVGFAIILAGGSITFGLCCIADAIRGNKK